MTKSAVFSKGAYTTSAPDNSRKILIGVTNSNGNALFHNCFLTNFENTRSADVMMVKDVCSTFGFTAFGQNPVNFTLAGIYMGEAPYEDAVRNKDKSDEDSKYDPEAVFDLYNISSTNRQEITITTMYPKGEGYNVGTNGRNAYHKPIEYKGYMIKFIKNPMNDDKMAAYGFNIICVCRQATKFDKTAQEVNK